MQRKMTLSFILNYGNYTKDGKMIGRLPQPVSNGT
jgi:hypothetical protein